MCYIVLSHLYFWCCMIVMPARAYGLLVTPKVSRSRVLVEPTRASGMFVTPRVLWSARLSRLMPTRAYGLLVTPRVLLVPTPSTRACVSLYVCARACVCIPCAGPGQYNPARPGESGWAATFGSEEARPPSLQERHWAHVPGPGAYGPGPQEPGPAFSLSRAARVTDLASVRCSESYCHLLDSSRLL